MPPPKNREREYDPVAGQRLLVDHHVQPVVAGCKGAIKSPLLEVIESDGLAFAGLLQAVHRVVVGASNSVEEGDDAARVRIRLLESLREHQPRECAFRDTSEPGEVRQSCGDLWPERDVESADSPAHSGRHNIDRCRLTSDGVVMPGLDG